MLQQVMERFAGKTLIRESYDNYIGGEWLAPTKGDYFNNISPVTGQVVCKIARGTAEDIELALDAAHKAKDAWGKTSATERANILLKMADRMEANLDLIAMAETIDNGKPIRETTHADIPLAIDHFRYFAGCVRAQEGSISEIDHDTIAYHFHEPLGVVGQIIPWNFPILMAVWKLAPALAAGNCIVLKPAEQTPMSILVLLEVIGDLLPSGVLNVVNGFGVEAGKPLASNKRISKIAFTGETTTGRLIMQYASENLIPVTLELGGKSPSLIFADADLDKAALGAALAIFFNSGQVCLAASRLYVERSVFDKVVEGVAQVARTFKLGHGRDPDTMLGPLVSKVQQGRVLDYIAQGKASGADLVTGGGTGDRDGYFVEPTIFANPDAEASIVREEIFGPVLVATPFDDVDEVVRRANDTRYGLAANIWTRDLSRAHLMARGLQAGTVWINTHGMNDPSAPFGGMKESGWGREVGEEGVLHYTETKTITALLD